jgi:hypothetical protein
VGCLVAGVSGWVGLVDFFCVWASAVLPTVSSKRILAKAATLEVEDMLCAAWRNEPNQGLAEQTGRGIAIFNVAAPLGQGR